MKQLIVLMAILPLMLMFLLQFTYEQQRSAGIGKLQELVYASKERAKQDGCFTEDNIRQMKSKIGKTFGIDENEVLFEGTTVPQFRINRFDEREMIYYKVGVPVANLMDGAGMMGISDDDNRMIYVIESCTAGQRLAD